MRYFVLILSTLLWWSCETHDAPEPIRVIPAQLQPFVDRFVWEAEKRNLTLDISKLSFEFEKGIDGGGNQGTVVGICSRSNNLDLVKIDTLNSLWLLSDHLGKEEVIFHELGHCLLNRQHRDQRFASGDFASIMRTIGLLQYGALNNFSTMFINPADLKAHRRDYYIEELFGENTANPCWSDPAAASPFPLTVFEEPFIEERNYRDLWVDHDNNLWFYGGDKNFRMMNGAFQQKIPELKISAMANDPDGDLWIAGFQDKELMVGVYKADLFESKFSSKDFPLQFTEIQQFLIDGDHRLWLSDELGNLYAQSDDGFELISGLPDGRVWTMRKGPGNSVYLLKGGQFFIFEGPNDFVQLNQDNSDLPAYFYRSLAVDTNGTAWLLVGGSAPFFVQLLPDFEVRTLDYYYINLAGLQVNSISSDAIGNIWVATSNGIKKWEGQSFSSYCTYNTGVPLLTFSRIAVGSNGVIWALGEDLENPGRKLMRSDPGS